MNNIFLFIILLPKNHFFEFFFQKMVIEILFNKKTQILSFETIHIFTHTHI